MMGLVLQCLREIKRQLCSFVCLFFLERKKKVNKYRNWKNATISNKQELTFKIKAGNSGSSIEEKRRVRVSFACRKW
jgi:hypothetical protein